MPGGELDRPRVGLERLDQDAAGRVAAAAARELGEQLERALLGPEVRQREARVGVDDRGQRDPFEVVALRDHLRAEQHRPVGRGEPLERRVTGRAESASSRTSSSSGRRAASSRSSRCVPAPSRASSADPHSGQSSGAGSPWPQ